MDTGFALSFFGALFAIMNPVSNLPVFLSVTDGAGAAAQRRIARAVASYVLVMGGAIAVAGSQVLSFFGIGIDAFRVAGGLVVLLIGMNMLNGEDSSAHHGTDKEKAAAPDSQAVAFYPLTFPILMGPGTITTLILFAHQAKGVANWIAYAMVFGGVVLSIAIVFSLAGRLSAYLSHTARVIMTRLMGMILAAIAVEMMTDGLKSLFPALAG